MVEHLRLLRKRIGEDYLLRGQTTIISSHRSTSSFEADLDAGKKDHLDEEELLHNPHAPYRKDDGTFDPAAPAIPGLAPRPSSRASSRGGRPGSPGGRRFMLGGKIGRTLVVSLFLSVLGGGVWREGDLLVQKRSRRQSETRSTLERRKK